MSGVLLAGRYELQRRIGKGGMAEVWSAIDTGLDRPVAIKWLRSNLVGDEVVAERFRREALAAARLNHPNIVAIHDVCEHDGRQAVVMQLVDGKSLRRILDSQKRLGPELTIHIGAAIAGALDAAHHAGFVHRDVKPGNILVTSDGRVLLTDFGIAKALQNADDEDLTSDNVMMGTAKYLSPEQVRGRPLDGRADLYSLALVLYECLAGRVPFLGETDADTALARLQRDPTDLAHLRPTLPIGLVNLIHRTLARNPHHRPQTGAALRAALLAVDAAPPDLDRTPADPPPRIANPPAQALRAGPGIPGEPHVSGAIPAIARDPRPTRDAAGTSNEPPSADPTPPTTHDTPVGPADLHARPARRHEQNMRRPTLLLGSLAALAVLIAIVLIVVTQRGEPATDLPTIDVTDTAAPDASAAPPTAAPASGPVAIAQLSSYDPGGDNGTENDEQVALAGADGDPATFWATECYYNQYLGGKGGVGVVATLTGPGAGVVSFDVGHAPYQVDVFATDAAEVPATLDGWQQIGDTSFADAAGSVSADITIDATHVLVWFKELGPDDACSGTNPYRGLLGELTFTD